VIKTRQAFNEDVRSFITKLVASGDEEVERAINIKIQVTGMKVKFRKKCLSKCQHRGKQKLPVKVAADEFVDFLLVDGVKVLEFVKSRKLFDVESIWGDDIGFTLQ